MAHPGTSPRTEIDKGSQASMSPRVARSWPLFSYGRALAAVSLIAFTAHGLMLAIGNVSSISTARAQTQDVVEIGAPAPDIAFTTTDGAQRRLSEFNGRPVMLWLFATWCPTCQVGTLAVAAEFDRLKQAGIQIIQLKLYNNLGYPGPSVADFAKRYASSVAPSPDWLWGDASREGSFTYDPGGYPDIYFLIDEDGILRTVAPAPHVTMDKILAFAGR